MKLPVLQQPFPNCNRENVVNFWIFANLTVSQCSINLHFYYYERTPKFLTCAIKSMEISINYLVEYICSFFKASVVVTIRVLVLDSLNNTLDIQVNLLSWWLIHKSRVSGNWFKILWYYKSMTFTCLKLEEIIKGFI